MNGACYSVNYVIASPSIFAFKINLRNTLKLIMPTQTAELHLLIMVKVYHFFYFAYTGLRLSHIGIK